MRFSANQVRAMVEKHGGQWKRDGTGGYDALAPVGKLWKNSETWNQPVPLGECESPEERQEVLAVAYRMVKDGVQ